MSIKNDNISLLGNLNQIERINETVLIFVDNYFQKCHNKGNFRFLCIVVVRILMLQGTRGT